GWRNCGGSTGSGTVRKRRTSKRRCRPRSSRCFSTTANAEDAEDSELFILSSSASSASSALGFFCPFLPQPMEVMHAALLFRAEAAAFIGAGAQVALHLFADGAIFELDLVAERNRAGARGGVHLVG